MKPNNFTEGGSRDGSSSFDEESLDLTRERRMAARIRRSGEKEETAFRQAKCSDVFEAKTDGFSGEMTDPFASKGSKFQRKQIRRSYAEALREEAEAEGIDGATGRTIIGADRRGDGKAGRRIVGKKKTIAARQKLARTGEAGLEQVRGTLDKSVLSGEESDAVSGRTARAGYGAARLSAAGAKKTVDIFEGKVARKADRLFSEETGRVVGRHFSTEKVSASGGAAVINPKTSAFYVGEENRAAIEAARQKTQRAFQRRLIRKNYQTAPEGTVYIPIVSRIRERARRRTGQAGAAAGKSVAKKIEEFFEQHPLLLIVLLLSGIFTVLVSAAISGGTMLMTHSLAPSTLGTTYTAEDADIKGAESDYRALEAELSGKLSDLEEQYPGYESYELSAGQIGHNPYELAALLTVLHEDYTREDVQDTLQKIFKTQYNLSLGDEAGRVERKTVRVGQSLGNVVTSGYCACSICCGQWAGGPTASGVMPTANHTIAVDARNPIVPMGTKVVMNGIEYTVEDTGNFARYGVAFDVYYDDHNAASQHGHKTWEAFIADDNGTQEVEVLVSSGHQEFSAVLKNNGLNYVAEKLLTKDEKERYDLLVETKGNKEELFANDIYANGAIPFDYSIPGEALSDQKFANMMAEAQKYLGYPYVWGGSTPSSSFDCSGFVCWVINHSGNGWNVGRTTADGLCNMLAKVAPSEAKPGDIIFFQGTYDTWGASHVGIYLGDNMMIHCGNPIQYARTDTAYWQQHFYCFGRLPS